MLNYLGVNFNGLKCFILQVCVNKLNNMTLKTIRCWEGYAIKCRLSALAYIIVQYKYRVRLLVYANE